MTAESIVAFLKARYDEDEQIARAAENGDIYMDVDHTATAEHYSRHDPERVLREVEAKRQILDEIVPVLDSMEAQIDGEWGTGHGPLEESDRLLRLLALPYSDHADYPSAVTPETP